MKLYCLNRTQILPIDLDEAWCFFSNPWNLQQITPPWLDFTIISDRTEKMYPGMIITYRIKTILDVPWTWVTEITHVRKLNFFVDEQRLGPYRFWHHQHVFKTHKFGVEMQDIVHYALSFGIIGRIINQLIIHDRLDEIFNYRRRALDQIFEASQEKRMFSPV